MKHTITTSTCCGAENPKTTTVAIRGGGYKNKIICADCKKECETKTITLTPDEDIAEAFNKAIRNNLNFADAELASKINNILKDLAEQLKINP